MDDKKLQEVAKFLTEQKKKLEALIDEGPEDNSVEMYFDDDTFESNPGPTGHGLDICYSDADLGL